MNGAIVALGGLGVVTKLVLDVRPSFRMRQDVYEGLALARMQEHFEDITRSADSVSLFTTWRGRAFDQLWLKREVTEVPFEPAPELFGATLATRPRHPIPGLSPAACTEQLGVAGPWHERLPHFRMDHTPSSGDELQSEYLVPREHLVAALAGLFGIRDRLAELVQVTEIRTIAPDQLWMSPCYGRASAGIHFTWRPDWGAVRSVLPLVEQLLTPFDARPHWGKLFTMPAPRVRSLYEKMPEFAELLRGFDPDGRFRNPFLDRYVFGSG
jgi:alditol oxidase